VTPYNVGKRIEVLKTPCDEKLVTKIDPLDDDLWCDVEDEKNYTIGINSFLARGKTTGKKVHL